MTLSQTNSSLCLGYSRYRLFASSPNLTSFLCQPRPVYAPQPTNVPFVRGPANSPTGTSQPNLTTLAPSVSTSASAFCHFGYEILAPFPRIFEALIGAFTLNLPLSLRAHLGFIPHQQPVVSPHSLSLPFTASSVYTLQRILPSANEALAVSHLRRLRSFS